MSTMFRTALLQLKVDFQEAFKVRNRAHAARKVEEVLVAALAGGELQDQGGGAAPRSGLDLVMLPEVWNGPYQASEFPKFCEKIPNVGQSLLREDSKLANGTTANGTDGPSPVENDSSSLTCLAELAVKYSTTILAGSIPERDEEGTFYVYNTARTAVLCAYKFQITFQNTIPCHRIKTDTEFLRVI